MLKLFRAGEQPSPSVLTIRDVIDLYLRHTAAEQNRLTFGERRRILLLFRDEHSALTLADARPHHLLLWMADHPAWKSNWTRRRVIGTVRTAFGWANKLGFIDRHPFAGVGYAVGQRGDAVEPAEFQAMLRGSTAVFRRVLVFMRFTGCRPGEMAATEWRHLDVASGCIVLKEHKTAQRTGRPRRIVLHPVAQRLIAWIARHGPHSQFVFVNAKRRRWRNTAIHWRIKQARRQAGVREDATLYFLRHGWITQAVLSGVDIATVAELAGHTSIETTQVYLHLANKTAHLRAAVQAVFPIARSRGN